MNEARKELQKKRERMVRKLNNMLPYVNNSDPASEIYIDDDLIQIAIESVVEDLPKDQQEIWRESLKEEFENDRRNGIRAMVLRRAEENLGVDNTRIRLVM